MFIFRMKSIGRYFTISINSFILGNGYLVLIGNYIPSPGADNVSANYNSFYINCLVLLCSSNNVTNFRMYPACSLNTDE